MAAVQQTAVLVILKRDIHRENKCDLFLTCSIVCIRLNCVSLHRIASGFMNLFKKISPDGDAPPTAKSNSELSAAAEGKQSARKGDTSEQGDDSKGSEETLKRGKF